MDGTLKNLILQLTTAKEVMVLLHEAHLLQPRMVDGTVSAARCGRKRRNTPIQEALRYRKNELAAVVHDGNVECSW